jgi:hypothetical protein
VGRARSLAAAVVIALALMAALAAPQVAFALQSPNHPTSGEMVEQPKKYDGTEVIFEGEAIGEAMVRGEDAWVHLNDDAYMFKNVEEGARLGGYNSGMSVWLPRSLSGRISTFGDYKHEGDIVRVRGTFNAACAQHGGDMDIHASSLEVTVPGRRAADPVKPGKLILAVVLTFAAAGVWYADRRLGHRERRGIAHRT